MFGWLRRAAAWASRRNRSTKLGSRANCGARILIATVPVERGVDAAEDLGHAAGADARLDAVPASQHGLPTLAPSAFVGLPARRPDDDRKAGRDGSDPFR